MVTLISAPCLLPADGFQTGGANEAVIRMLISIGRYDDNTPPTFR